MSTRNLDLLIIGAGPAGLSAGDAAEKEGLHYLIIEKGLIANTIYEYPIGLTVFSTPDELEMHEGTLKPCRDKPTREELLLHYLKFALERKLQINSEEEATKLERNNSNGFLLTTTKGLYSASAILFCIGAMARPRRINAPGEDLPKVHHRFSEPFPFVNKDVLVIGGGNSAAEAVLFLTETGARTTFAIWRSDWENSDPKKGAIKNWVRKPLEELVEAGKLRLIFFSEIERITKSDVAIKDEGGQLLVLANDAVFVLIGSDADLTLLKEIGVKTEPSGFTEVPVYDPETFETNVRGIYVAGHFTHARHIKEAIAVPRRIVPLIARELRAGIK